VPEAAGSGRQKVRALEGYRLVDEAVDPSAGGDVREPVAVGSFEDKAVALFRRGVFCG